MLSGKGRRFDSHVVVHRRHRVEISADGERVGAGDFGVIGVRHCRIKTRTVSPSPFRQCIDEFVVRPGADPGLRIGSDVWRDKFTKRRLDRAPTGKSVVAARQRVTGRAIADDGQITAALGLSKILGIDSGRARGVGWRGQRQGEQKNAPQLPFLTHARADPDFSDIANGWRPPTRTPARPPCQSGCNRHSAERRSRPAQTGWEYPNSADRC